jgi:uncharacterized protein involved in type VI secretion and phage assembly
MPDKRFGKYTATVVNNQDAEKSGRLEVQIPTIAPETMFATPGLPFGFFFVPENGATVLVEFEGGDSRSAIWSAVKYLENQPWAEEADVPEKRILKTAKGHLVVFQDADGEESIEIKDGVNGHAITLDKDGIKVVDGKNNHTVTLASSGVTLESGADVTIKGQNITIEAQTKLTMKGPEVSVEADAKLTAKGNPIHLNP